MHSGLNPCQVVVVEVVLVTQWCLTLSDPMDCSPLGSSVHVILQARIMAAAAAAKLRQSCPTLLPHDCSTPGFPVHHQLPELAQIHVHRVSDAIQPFHPLSSPSPPAFSLSQYQGLF